MCLLDIKSMFKENIIDLLKEENWQNYRANQVYSWLVRGANSFDEMINLPKDLRLFLKKKCYISNVQIEKNLFLKSMAR